MIRRTSELELPDELRAMSEFAAIGDRAERSRALFGEAARVLLHPRCINCHPAGDAPTGPRW